MKINVMCIAAVFAAGTMCCSAAYAAYPKHLRVTTPNGRSVTVTAFNENIIKVTNTPAGVAERRGTASVLDESNLGQCLNPNGSGMAANFGGVQVTLTAQGNLTLNAGPGKTVTDNGLRAGKDGSQVLELGVDARGSFYGAGERGHKLNMRGDTLTMYNRQNYGYTGSDPRIKQMNITMPLFVANDGYAIVFDDYAPAQMILGNPVKYITESPEPVSWYFVNGARSMADVTESLSQLTGRQELPPLWSLGYVTSKYGYKTQTETEATIDTLRTQGYPVDGIVLDLYWYGKEEDMGRLSWDAEQWPDARGMLQRLRGRGVDVVTITQPYVLRNGRGVDNYNELASKGLLLPDSTGRAPQEVKIWVGEGGMFDVSNPATLQWMSNRYSQLTDLGVGGWWGDLGEPEVHPETALHANGLKARQYHNRYCNDWSRMVYDLYKNKYNDRRLLSMMRGGTTGLQRYDVFPWSTDVSRSWGGMEPQIRIMLNSGLSGLGYMGHDVGGFAVDPKNPEDAELYVRWLQLGLFSPMLRTHATYKAEPYHYTQYQDIIKPIILERYRWLPYNYTLAWENATKGYPMVRPLNYHSDASTGADYGNVVDQYLWGPNVMVAPVMKQGAVSRDIVMPAGDNWYDYNHPDKIYAGGQTVKDYAAPLNVLPLFVREGSFLPQTEQQMESTKQYNPAQLTVQYYPSLSRATQSVMFEDGRQLPSSVTGNKGRVITFSGDATNQGATITLSAEGSYQGMDLQKDVKLIMHNVTSAPKKVKLNAGKLRYQYNPYNHTLTMTFGWNPFKPAILNIEYKK